MLQSYATLISLQLVCLLLKKSDFIHNSIMIFKHWSMGVIAWCLGF